MKPKTLLIIAILLSFAVASFFLADARSSLRAAGDNAASRDQVQPAVKSGLEKQLPQQQVSSRPSNGREKEIRIGLERANVPIKFYGKIVDQLGGALEGVKVNYKVVRSGVLNVVGGIDNDILSGQTQSDASGLFSIEGYRGLNIALESLEKAGYRESKSTRRVFGYSATPEVFTPDPSNPVTFVLLSSELVGKIKKTRWKLSVVWDGVPRSYDIESGVSNRSGELVLTASRNAPTLPDRADWSLELSCRGGGLLAVGQGAGFVAPMEGYSEKIRWKSEVIWQNFRSGVTEQVFVKRQNGTYARLNISIYAEPTREKNSFIVDYFVAEDGGRILE